MWPVRAPGWDRGGGTTQREGTAVRKALRALWWGLAYIGSGMEDGLTEILWHDAGQAMTGALETQRWWDLHRLGINGYGTDFPRSLR